MKKAVAYIRVSTKSKAQLHSYDYQLQYWQNTIVNNTEYEFAGIYSDYGLSGRLISKRPQLLEMIEDAKKGKFDVVFTKSVSRMGRNTAELLEIVRELRDCGVMVVFEKECIDSFMPNAELYITIAASVAENDLRVYSENEKWSYIQRFKKGEVWFGCRIYGYKIDNENNTLIVVAEEAKIVKRIFELYLSGKGFGVISNILEEEKIPNSRGKSEWTLSALKYIISNERYTGNSLCQKTIRENGMSKKNKGIQKQYYVENTHEAIIDQETFDKAQELRRERSPKGLIGKKVTEIYPFTGKVYCAECGKKFVHKYNHTNKPYRVAIWMCPRKNAYVSGKCNNHMIKDEVLKEKFVESFNEYVRNKLLSDEETRLKNEVKELIDNETELNSLRVNRVIKLEDYNVLVGELKNKIEIKTKELSDMLMRSIKQSDYVEIKEFDESKVDKFLDKAIIDNYTVTFRFVNGVEITKPYTNGKPGNKKGWNKHGKSGS